MLDADVITISQGLDGFVWRSHVCTNLSAPFYFILPDKGGPEYGGNFTFVSWLYIIPTVTFFTLECSYDVLPGFLSHDAQPRLY